MAQDQQPSSELPGGGTFRVHVASPKGEEHSFAVVESVMAAGFVGPPRHSHPRMDEFFFVLEGQVELEIDGERRWITAGNAGHMPRGHIHRVWGPGDKPARVLAVMSPGIYQSILAMQARGGDNGAHDASKVADVMIEYDTVMADNPLEALSAE